MELLDFSSGDHNNSINFSQSADSRASIIRDSTIIKVENLIDASMISDEELAPIIKALLDTEDFERRLEIIEEMKQPFLFTSAHLLKIIEEITSIKTKLAIISAIGPRLTDPKAKITELMDLFRFSEEKSKVEEILKSRAVAITSSLFKSSSGGAISAPNRVRSQTASSNGAGRGTGLRNVNSGRIPSLGERGKSMSMMNVKAGMLDLKNPSPPKASPSPMTPVSTAKKAISIAKANAGTPTKDVKTSSQSLLSAKKPIRDTQPLSPKIVTSSPSSSTNTSSKDNSTPVTPLNLESEGNIFNFKLSGSESPRNITSQSKKEENTSTSTKNLTEAPSLSTESSENVVDKNVVKQALSTPSSPKKVVVKVAAKPIASANKQIETSVPSVSPLVDKSKAKTSEDISKTEEIDKPNQEQAQSDTQVLSSQSQAVPVKSGVPRTILKTTTVKPLVKSTEEIKATEKTVSTSIKSDEVSGGKPQVSISVPAEATTVKSLSKPISTPSTPKSAPVSLPTTPKPIKAQVLAVSSPNGTNKVEVAAVSSVPLETSKPEETEVSNKKSIASIVDPSSLSSVSKDSCEEKTTNDSESSSCWGPASDRFKQLKEGKDEPMSPCKSSAVTSAKPVSPKVATITEQPLPIEQVVADLPVKVEEVVAPVAVSVVPNPAVKPSKPTPQSKMKNIAVILPKKLPPQATVSSSSTTATSATATESSNSSVNPKV